MVVARFFHIIDLLCSAQLGACDCALQSLELFELSTERGRKTERKKERNIPEKGEKERGIS
jgi:hypothetical protein